MTRVAVIGAGPSGTAVLRAFKSAQENGAGIPEIVCYEKQATWGGLWNYSWRTGLDEHGEPVHSSMYRYLWSNGPKEGLEFADYSFVEHFGKPIPSYPPRAVLRDYIAGRVEKAGVEGWCKFNHAVKWVDYDEKSEKFTVSVHDHNTDTISSSVFDKVIVCSGHFSTPNVPSFPGFESFAGRVLHAHDFRDALEFKDKRILIIGTSYSAEDIGSQCWKYGAKSIVVSHRTAPLPYDFPENWSQHPLLTSVSGNTATFKDGSTAEVDAIILCTGYLHSFPFLPDPLRLKTDNRLWPLGLYKGCVWEKNTNLFYIGMQDQWYTFNMFDAQAWYTRDVILGKIALPSLDEMKNDSQSWRDREEAIPDDYKAIEFQGSHVEDLIALTDYPSFDVPAVNNVFFEWKKHKKQGIMKFRDHSYKSIMTGHDAPVHHTDWVHCLDDSMEDYLRTDAK